MLAELVQTNFWFLIFIGCIANALMVLVLVMAFKDTSLDDDSSLSSMITDGQASYLGSTMLILYGIADAWMLLAWLRIGPQRSRCLLAVLRGLALVVCTGYIGIAIFPLSMDGDNHEGLTVATTLAQSAIFALAFVSGWCKWLDLHTVDAVAVAIAVAWSMAFNVLMLSRAAWAGRAFRLDLLTLEAVTIAFVWCITAVLLWVGNNRNVTLNLQSHQASIL